MRLKRIRRVALCLAMMLAKMGLRITLAVNGQEAVVQVGNRVFDVVLVDIQMPVMSGVQTTQLIRKAELETERKTPIVAMTAHAMSGDREKYLASGIDGYVSKPIRTDLLREEIVRVVQFAGMCARSREVSAMKNEGSKSLDREEFLNRVEHDEELAREILDFSGRFTDQSRSAWHRFGSRQRGGSAQRGSCVQGNAGEPLREPSVGGHGSSGRVSQRSQDRRTRGRVAGLRKGTEWRIAGSGTPACWSAAMRKIL